MRMRGIGAVDNKLAGRKLGAAMLQRCLIASSQEEYRRPLLIDFDATNPSQMLVTPLQPKPCKINFGKLSAKLALALNEEVDIGSANRGLIHVGIAEICKCTARHNCCLPQ